MHNFRNLQIWKQGISIVLEVYNLTKKLPTHEKFNLISQITRSAVSIPSNIAEGCSRSSYKDFIRFLEIALGSAYELETQLIVVEKLNYLEEKTFLLTLINLVHEEEKMIAGFINSLDKKKE